MVHHTLDDAVDRIQKVGVLAHRQDSVDLGVQQVVAENKTHPLFRLYKWCSINSTVCALT